MKTQLQLASELGFLQLMPDLTQLIDEVGKLITGLSKTLTAPRYLLTANRYNAILLYNVASYLLECLDNEVKK